MMRRDQHREVRIGGFGGGQFRDHVNRRGYSDGNNNQGRDRDREKDRKGYRKIDYERDVGRKRARSSEKSKDYDPLNHELSSRRNSARSSGTNDTVGSLGNSARGRAAAVASDDSRKMKELDDDLSSFVVPGFSIDEAGSEEANKKQKIGI